MTAAKSDIWPIKHVPQRTRQKIHQYRAQRAVELNRTMELAEALDEIADIALTYMQRQAKSLPKVPMERPHASTGGSTAEQMGESVRQ